MVGLLLIISISWILLNSLARSSQENETASNKHFIFYSMFINRNCFHQQNLFHWCQQICSWKKGLPLGQEWKCLLRKKISIVNNDFQTEQNKNLIHYTFGL
jgi:hypothetical protein